MKKILVLFTGGTIGSIKVPIVNSKGLVSHVIMQPYEARNLNIDVTDAKSLLLTRYHEIYPNSYSYFDTKIIMEVLSENMTINIWNTLVNELKNINFNDYSGIIITHGTDTLGYTANFLSIILNAISIPVILVSSNYEVTDNRANGIINFKAAIDFIQKCHLPGVYTTYNSNGKTKLIYGSRLQQCKSIIDDFESISADMMPLGYIDSNGQFNVRDYDLLSRIEARIPGQSIVGGLRRIDSKVCVINPYVGLDYDMIDLSKKANAILHTLYHSGTACVLGDSYNSILSFIKRINKIGDIGIYMGPIYGKDDKDLYSSSSELVKLGVDFIMNVSKENAYTKLVLAYSLYKNKKDIKDFLYTDINEEYIKPSKILKKY